MSLEHSHKIIKDIADRREADAYFEELLKAPAMRADMERAASKWDALMKDSDTIAPEPPQSEMERER